MNSFSAMMQYAKNPHGFLRAQHEQHGDTVAVHLPGQKWMFFSTPDAARTIFTAPLSTARAGEFNAAALSPILGTNGVFTGDGEVHLERRRLMSPAFRGERMQTYGAMLSALARQMAGAWREGDEVALFPFFTELTRRLIVQTVFGTDDPVLTRALARITDDCLNTPLLVLRPLQWDLGRYSPWGRIMHILREADRAIYALIAERKKATPGDDILSLLISAGLTDQELRNELVTLIVGGQDTVTTALTWLFQLLPTHKEVLARVRDESDSAYLDAAIKESLRIRPVIPHYGNRKLAEPLEVEGITVPAGSFVAVSAVRLHFRPELYAEPTRFMPERFLTTQPDPYAWVPFGGGGRRCLGMHLALYQMRMVTKAILEHVDLELLDTSGAERTRAFTRIPKDDLRARVRRS